MDRLFVICEIGENMKKTLLMLLVLILTACSQSQDQTQSQKKSDNPADVVTTASIKTDQTGLEVIKDPLTRSETLLHTAVTLQIYHPNQEAAMEQAFNYMKEMEQLFSTNLSGSDVYKINQAAGKEAVKVHPETFEVIQRAIDVAEQSQGLFDISIGALTNLWQIGSDQARVPSDQEIQTALTKIDYHKITLDDQAQTVKLEEAGMALELGGISKGFIGSGVADILKEHGISTAIINLGGNVIVMGQNPANQAGWNVGVQDPDKVRGAIVGSQRVQEGAIVTSGIYERYLEQDGKKYHHIMDPNTGYPLDNNISGVTVFAPTSFDGDAYSTALFLLGIDQGLDLINRLDGYEVVYIDKDKGVHLSDGLKESFQLTNKEYHIVNE